MKWTKFSLKHVWLVNFPVFLYYPSDDGRIGILNRHNSLLLGINFPKNNLFMRRFRDTKKIRIRTPIIYMTQNKITCGDR